MRFEIVRRLRSAARELTATPAGRRRVLACCLALACITVLASLTALRSKSRGWAQYSSLFVIVVVYVFAIYLFMWKWARGRWLSALPPAALTWSAVEAAQGRQERLRSAARWAAQPRQLVSAGWIILLIPTAIAIAFPLTSGAWPTPAPREEPFPFAVTCMNFAVVTLQVVFLQLIVDAVYLSVARCRDAWRRRRAAPAPAPGALPVPPDAGGAAASIPMPLEVEQAPPAKAAATKGSGCWAATRRRCAPRPLPLWLVASQAALIIASAIWGFVEGAKPPAVYTVTLALPHLPPALDGFKLAMMSDVHVGPTVGKSRVAAAVDIVNALSPDMTAIVGDLLDAHEDYLRPMVSPLALLRSPQVFVSGNHEYLSGNYDAKLALVASYNITILQNEVARVRKDPSTGAVTVTVPPPAGPDDASFDLLGVPDWAESVKPGPWVHADLPAAAAGRNVSRPLVVAAHQPRHAAQALAAQAGLVMNGHVHCGQILPIHLASYVGNPLFCGLYPKPNAAGEQAYVYVGGGTYGWGPLMRQAAQREVTLFVLRSPEVVGAAYPATVVASD